MPCMVLILLLLKIRTIYPWFLNNYLISTYDIILIIFKRYLGILGVCNLNAINHHYLCTPRRIATAVYLDYSCVSEARLAYSVVDPTRQRYTRGYESDKPTRRPQKWLNRVSTWEGGLTTTRDYRSKGDSD